MADGLAPLRQIGIVTKDADAAMAHWSRVFGVGPFCVLRHLTFEDFRYMGEISASPDLTLAIAQSNDLQVEIIEQHNDVSSVYRDYLAAGNVDGVQHLCLWYRERASYDAARTGFLNKDFILAQEGRASGVDVRFAYFSDPKGPKWPQVEISEGLSPTLLPIIDRLRLLAADSQAHIVVSPFEGLAGLLSAGYERSDGILRRRPIRVTHAGSSRTVTSGDRRSEIR